MTLHQTLRYISIAFLAGTVLAALHMTIWPGLYFFCIPFFFIRRWFFIRILLVALALALGGLYVGQWRKNHTLSLPFDTSLDITGSIIEAPDIRGTTVFYTVLPEGNTAAVLVKARRYPGFQYGDIVTLSGIELAAPEAFNGFNYPLFLERYGVLATAKQPRSIRLVGHSPPSKIIGYLYLLRSYIEQEFNRLLPEPESSFLSGVLLGSKRAIPTSIQNALRDTGTSHIIAISGANITILLGLLTALLPSGSAKAKFWATLSISAFITVLTGASASVIRGSVIACLGSYLKMMSRRAWATPLIIFSMLLMLLGNPLLLAADPGFQLSFAAFAGLTYAGDFCTNLLEHPRVQFLPEVIRATLGETLAASLGTLPLSFKLFGQLPFLTFIVNPLILGLLSPITLLGLILIPLTKLSWIAKAICLPLWMMLHTILSIIVFFGTHFSFLTLHYSLSWLAVFISYAVLALLLRRYTHV